MTTSTPLRELLEVKLSGIDTNLDTFVTKRRDGDLSWQRIAYDLLLTTGVAVTDETLRNWYADAA